MEHPVYRGKNVMTIDTQNGSGNVYRKALNTALRILTRRDHSKHELSQKLKARGYDEDVIDDVISECQRFDYINDERTAQSVIRRLQRKGYGRKRIQIELNSKGLTGKHIQVVLLKRTSEADECQFAKKILHKHARRFDREKDELKRKDKIYRFLYQRGYSKTVISQFVNGAG